MKGVPYLLLISILVLACNSRSGFEKEHIGDACIRCWKSNLQFIDTLKNTSDIDSIVYRKFRNHDYTLLSIGFAYNREKELFIQAYVKVRYDIEFIGVGDVAFSDYTHYNEIMWKLLFDKYKIDEGILNRECDEKYKKFKIDNELK